MQKQFEVRLAVEPAGPWKAIVAESAIEAAEAFVADFERTIRRWEIATSKRAVIVIVRETANIAVTACYRVTGRLEPRYLAALELPGATVSAEGG